MSARERENFLGGGMYAGVFYPTLGELQRAMLDDVCGVRASAYARELEAERIPKRATQTEAMNDWDERFKSYHSDERGLWHWDCP